jgi:hypothetical protein
MTALVEEGKTLCGYFLPAGLGVIPAAVRIALVSGANWPLGSRSKYFW